jgi:hypothetical protein
MARRVPPIDDGASSRNAGISGVFEEIDVTSFERNYLRRKQEREIEVPTSSQRIAGSRADAGQRLRPGRSSKDAAMGYDSARPCPSEAHSTPAPPPFAKA